VVETFWIAALQINVLRCGYHTNYEISAKLFEAHWMWFIFITARLFIFLRFQPRLAATL
jgi:hypothetical protein